MLYLTKSNNRKIGIEISCVENVLKIYFRRWLSTYDQRVWPYKENCNHFIGNKKFQESFSYTLIF